MIKGPKTCTADKPGTASAAQGVHLDLRLCGVGHSVDHIAIVGLLQVGACLLRACRALSRTLQVAWRLVLLPLKLHLRSTCSTLPPSDSAPRSEDCGQLATYLLLCSRAVEHGL